MKHSQLNWSTPRPLAASFTRSLMLLSAIWLVAAIEANAQPFDAWASYSVESPGYSEIPDHADLNPTEAITLEAWVAFDAGSVGCQTIIGKGYEAGYWLGYCNGALRSWIGGINHDTEIQRPTGRWVHVAVTSDGAVRRHYFDGALVSQTNESGALLANANALRIGGDVDWPKAFTGVIDEVRLWDRVRSPEEIRSTMRMALEAPVDGLVAVWNFGPNDALGNHSGDIHGDVIGLTVPPGGCWNSSSQACLGDRFVVTAEWATSTDSGKAQLAPAFSEDTGIFSFFSSENWELMVKVLDGCGVNNNYWVFLAASTDVEYTVTVRDSLTGEVATYTNPLGNAAPATTDVTALPVCTP